VASGVGLADVTGGVDLVTEHHHAAEGEHRDVAGRRTLTNAAVVAGDVVAEVLSDRPIWWPL